MNSSKKILLFGPIGDFGGRELETGFIASVLSTKYNVAICTTGTITKDSQVFDFNKNLTVFSVKERLFKRFFALKILAFFSFLKSKGKGKVQDYVNNALAKKRLGYDKKVETVLENAIATCDVIFIIAQLSSALLNSVITIANNNNKRILFRTTGTIAFSDYNFISFVDCFIHHSQNNANQIESKQDKYVIIDQCAYNEESLLKIKSRSNYISKFLILSRLSPEKGVEELIDFFLRVCSKNDVLKIAGNGNLEKELKRKYANIKNIQFLGFVKADKLHSLFQDIDCVIIPSPEETGPLVGIEAMCAGKVIISTKVGAMCERLTDTLNDYWFEYDEFKTFEKSFFAIKGLEEKQLDTITNKLREKYLKNYSVASISAKYLQVVSNVIENHS